MIEATRELASPLQCDAAAVTGSVVVFEREPLVAEALTIQMERAGYVVTVCSVVDELYRALATAKPGAVVVDLSSEPEANRAALLHGVWTACPGVRAVVLAGADKNVIERCVLEGPRVVLSRATTASRDITAALEAFGVPRTSDRSELDVLFSSLTRREREVLHYVGMGHDNIKIGALLGISERTVRAHAGALYRKLGVENRAQLAVLAFQREL